MFNNLFHWSQGTVTFYSSGGQEARTRNFESGVSCSQWPTAPIHNRRVIPRMRRPPLPDPAPGIWGWGLERSWALLSSSHQTPGGTARQRGRGGGQIATSPGPKGPGSQILMGNSQRQRLWIQTLSPCRDLFPPDLTCYLLSRFSRVRLCNPIDGSPSGSSVHRIFQARVLEWGAIAFSGEERRGDANGNSALSAQFFWKPKLFKSK